MLKFNNTHIFTGYLKQLLASKNIPMCRIYTKEFARYYDKYHKEDPRVLESFDTLSKNRLSTRINYIKNNDICNYFWKPNRENLTADKQVSWEISKIDSYDSEKQVHGLTRTLYNPGRFYDYYTHEYLGDYLRFIRDYYDMNLMPLYNCFNDRICNNINCEILLHDSSIKEENIKAIFYSQDPKYKIYALPVKLFANYTIAIDCNQGIELCCGLYNKTLDTSEKAIDLMKKTYQKVSKTIFNQPFLYKKLDVQEWTFEKDLQIQADKYKAETHRLLIPEKITRWDIANREQDLKLFIKVPTACKSSIVILEGDYRTYNNCKYVPPGRFMLDGTLYDEVPEVVRPEEPEVVRASWEVLQNHSVLNFSKDLKNKLNEPFSPIGKLQLLAFNTGESYPFSDRLIEYLVGSAITPLDEIPDNIKRVQKVMNQNNTYFAVEGMWEDKIQRVIYDYIIKSGPIKIVNEKLEDKRKGYHTAIGKNSKNNLYDVLGYIDKDAEKWYASWKAVKGDTKARVKDNIQNIDIYNGLYDI